MERLAGRKNRSWPCGQDRVSRWSGCDLVGAPRQLPAGADVVAGVPVGVTLQVVLVLGLGLPERPGGRHLGNHLAGPQAGGLDVGDGVLGGLLLRVAEVEDGRPVAGPDVVALPVQRGRVVDLEEELQQVPVGGLVRVEGDLDRLGVAVVVAVGGVRHVTAGVADPARDHAGELADEVLHAPETAAGEDGLLSRHDDALPVLCVCANSLRRRWIPCSPGHRGSWDRERAPAGGRCVQVVAGGTEPWRRPGMTGGRWSSGEPVCTEDVEGSTRPAAYYLAESRDGLYAPYVVRTPADEGRFPFVFHCHSQGRRTGTAPRRRVCAPRRAHTGHRVTRPGNRPRDGWTPRRLRCRRARRNSTARRSCRACARAPSHQQPPARTFRRPGPAPGPMILDDLGCKESSACANC